MKVTISIYAGPHHEPPTKASTQKNIEALLRYGNGKPQTGDTILLRDTISILRAIQKELTE